MFAVGCRLRHEALTYKDGRELANAWTYHVLIKDDMRERAFTQMKVENYESY